MPLPQLAVENQPAADTGSDRDDGETAVAAGWSKPLFGDRQGVDVVLDDDGHLHAVGNELAQRHVAPSQEWRLVQNSGRAVDVTGQADAYA